MRCWMMSGNHTNGLEQMSADDYMGKTRSGALWEPQFIIDINQSDCMGCGRCYKVCSRNVFDLVERDVDDDDELMFGFADQVMMVMELNDAGDCIGCGSCYKVCPKGCHTHEPASAIG